MATRNVAASCAVQTSLSAEAHGANASGSSMSSTKVEASPGVATSASGGTTGTSYQVRVQALNGETPSDWSDPSDAVSTNAEAAPPYG